MEFDYFACFESDLLSAYLASVILSEQRAIIAHVRHVFRALQCLLAQILTRVHDFVQPLAIISEANQFPFHFFNATQHECPEVEDLIYYSEYSFNCFGS